MVLHLDWGDFVATVTSPVRRSDLVSPDGTTVVVENAQTQAPPGLVEAIAGLACLIVFDAAEGTSEGASRVADVMAEGADLEAILDRATANPLTSTCLAMLLRGSERRSVSEGLAAESALYSMLQAGPEFQQWRLTHPARSRQPPAQPVVLTERAGNLLTITLNRPEVCNAFNARMRDELWEALLVATIDPSVRVKWIGAGPAFCSGGDLDEFGTLPDPASAHLIRLSRSIGSLVHDLSARITAELHGTCVGSGIELPAFAGRVIAHPDTTIALPEVALGLIPGAGGTVSLPRRIGRHRTAWLAFTGRDIDTATACEWGLVDSIL